MSKAIVIGKFYPPHKGHRYLIETALSGADEVTVIVCDNKKQKISASLRAEWIKETTPRANVIIVDDCLPEDDSEAWARYTLKVLGYAPDFVFTSEGYGDAYAGFMGSKHTLVDKTRKTVPVSSTDIRDNPLAYWDYTDPCVRAYFAKRVCVLGAESSGTTTLARSLAEHYKTVWVPEFGRMYWEAKMNLPASGWDTSEFVFIAGEQNKLEDKLARKCDKILICDTDSFATSVWHERYVGFISPEVSALSENRNYEIYFLTDPGIPFVQDGTRDGEHIRLGMHKRFEEELKKRNKNYVLLAGDHNARLSKAIEICDDILARNNYF